MFSTDRVIVKSKYGGARQHTRFTLKDKSVLFKSDKEKRR